MTVPFDPSRGLHPGPVGPNTRARSITPADNADLPMVARHIYVGVAGNLSVVLRDDPVGSAPVLFSNVPVGRIELWARQVWATGTTASALVALG